LKPALLLIGLASPAWATCGGYEQTFLHCEIVKSAKTVSVCFDDEIARYRFGPYLGTPELELFEPIATLDYTPWPGAGDTIWEDVTFSNAGYTYTVSAGYRRIIPEDPTERIETRTFGGVRVARGGETIADLECEPNAYYSDGDGMLEDAKNQLGFVWDRITGTWVELPD
jgi:hypothetical protein